VRTLNPSAKPSMGLKPGAPLAAAILCLLAAASLALAAETTRAEYTARVEPICKASTQANKKILAGVREEVKQGKLKPAAAQFAKASSALKKTLAKLKAVPQPAADKARLTDWLGYVAEEAELFKKASLKLAAGNKAAAEAIVARLQYTATIANNEVVAFEFTWCRLEPSKFT